MLRYILQRGFLDGKQGLIWHVLQGFWYRFLVDAKIWEIKHTSPPAPLHGERGARKGEGLKESERDRIVAWLKEKYNISG